MCGFAGSFGNAQPSEAIAARLEATLRHRGPDGHRQMRTELGGRDLFLHHARLAIIDLDKRALQPFQKDHLTLVYNGEIYNYLELREELRALGHVFVSSSDTEVVLEAYRRWGEACVDRFEGMWSLVLADKTRGGLWISRDRFGEKPLFYLQRGQTLHFASEVKALALLAGYWPKINSEKLKAYLVNGYKSIHKEPGTWFQEIRSFPAASSAFVRNPSEIEPRTYWSLSYKPKAMSSKDAEEQVLEKFRRALGLRLRADVPVAFCLSGGIDSTLLSCTAAKVFGQKLHAFSIIDQDSRYDERDNIDLVVDDLDIQNHQVLLGSDDFLDRMETLVCAHDAPIATISYYVHSFLSEAISAKGFKVAMSGTGADELFSGYYDHYNFWLAEHVTPDNQRQLVSDWSESFGSHVRNPILKNPLVFLGSPDERGHIYLDRDVFAGLMVEPFERDFAESRYSSNILRNRMLNELFEEIVPVILEEDDLNSMQWSVENRSPFLDRELAELAYSIPNSHLIRDGYSKWLLRSAGAGVVPDGVRLDKRKRGFNASIDTLLDRSDPHTIEWLLQPGEIFDYVRRDLLEQFLTNEMTQNSYSKFLFSFVSARLFLDKVRSFEA